MNSCEPAARPRRRANRRRPSGAKNAERVEATAREGEARSTGSSRRVDAVEGGASRPGNEQGSKPDRLRRRRPEKPGPDRRKLALAEAKTNQKAIADELQKMLDGLSEFETYRGVVKDAQELLKQHEQTMKQTDEAADKPEMMGKPLDALDARNRRRSWAIWLPGNLRSARACKTCWSGWARWRGRLDESDPLASAAMREAAEKSGSRGPPASSARPPINWKRTRWARPSRAAGAGSRRAERPGRRDPEPPRARAFPAGQGAQERRGRARQDARQAGPEPEEDARGPEEPQCQGARGPVEAAGQGTGRDPAKT